MNLHHRQMLTLEAYVLNSMVNVSFYVYYRVKQITITIELNILD